MAKIEQEFTNALAQGRQPNCVYCGAPLEVDQYLFHWVAFVWDKTKKRYRKVDEEGDSERPCCSRCGCNDSDFIGTDAGRKLGLDY